MNVNVTKGAVMMSLLGVITVVFVTIVVAGYLFWRWDTHPVIVTITEPLAEDFPIDGFSHQAFEILLKKYVSSSGRVDYASWKHDPAALRQLDQYLAAVARYSPENQPHRFNELNSALIYWVQSYNAVVIRSILNHWPLSSVTELKAPVEIVRGLGFFYTRKFIFGGVAYNLYQVENEKIFSGKTDPRVHFILNCGSESCPALRPQLPTGKKLEVLLASAAREFVADQRNVAINHQQKTIALSTIFKWNKDDFIKVVEAKDGNGTLVDYLLSIGDEGFIRQLESAGDYQIIYTEYDWSVNKQPLANQSNIIDG